MFGWDISLNFIISSHETIKTCDQSVSDSRAHNQEFHSGHKRGSGNNVNDSNHAEILYTIRHV